MIDAAITKPPAFDVVVVHSFSRFFRGQFQLEFHVRRLAKSGVCLVSITQELGDDPMSNMIRQIIALFDEYQSKENAKHALRAMKENARQGFWNDHLRALAQRIEVDAKEVRIIGSKRVLLRTLVATESAKTAGFGVPGFVPKWPLWRQRSTGLIEIKRPVSAMTLVTCDHC